MVQSQHRLTGAASSPALNNFIDYVILKFVHHDKSSNTTYKNPPNFSLFFLPISKLTWNRCLEISPIENNPKIFIYYTSILVYIIYSIEWADSLVDNSSISHNYVKIIFQTYYMYTKRSVNYIWKLEALLFMARVR